MNPFPPVGLEGRNQYLLPKPGDPHTAWVGHHDSSPLDHIIDAGHLPSWTSPRSSPPPAQLRPQHLPEEQQEKTLYSGMPRKNNFTVVRTVVHGNYHCTSCYKTIVIICACCTIQKVLYRVYIRLNYQKFQALFQSPSNPQINTANQDLRNTANKNNPYPCTQYASSVLLFCHCLRAMFVCKEQSHLPAAARPRSAGDAACAASAAAVAAACACNCKGLEATASAPNAMWRYAGGAAQQEKHPKHQTQETIDVQ